MAVTYQLIEAPYPYLCAIFRCRCGGVSVRHGDEAGTPPPGWERGTEGGEDYRCPGCAAAQRAERA